MCRLTGLIEAILEVLPLIMKATDMQKTVLITDAKRKLQKRNREEAKRNLEQDRRLSARETFRHAKYKLHMEK